MYISFHKALVMKIKGHSGEKRKLNIQTTKLMTRSTATSVRTDAVKILMDTFLFRVYSQQ